jgi:hypothetical protein
MPVLRGDVEISSLLRLTISLFSGKCNGHGLMVIGTCPELGSTTVIRQLGRLTYDN